MFVDYNIENLIIIQSNGPLQPSVSFKGKGANDVTFINEHHVAVTNYKSQTISVIDVSSSKVIKTHQMKRNYTYGWTFMHTCSISIETEKVSNVRDDKTVVTNSNIDTMATGSAIHAMIRTRLLS